jgi:diguanylate cyclase (GGDEF)-like protein
MRIGETRPIDQTRLSRREHGASNQYQRAKSLLVQTPEDTVSIMGIPEAEITPKVRSAIVSLMEEVDALRQDLDNSQRRITFLERLAEQDTLVPVANRRAFVRELTRVIAFGERYNEPTSLIYLDINDFKTINQEYGFTAGDEALRFVANTLLDQVRESDTIGRMGGDEFGIILWRTGKDGAALKARELAIAVGGETIRHEEHSFILRAAFGTATFRPGSSASQLMAAANQAMQENKTDKQGD